jgi:uncharacterized membrane protein YfcA
MTYTPHDLLIIGLVMTFGSIVQGTVGFASGLMGVPMLVLFGYPLRDATVVNFILTAVQNVAGAAQLWSYLDPRELIWPSILRMAGLPLGIYALSMADGSDADLVKQIVGAVLLLLVLLLGGLRPQPRDHLHGGWTLLAFVSSGFLMGFASIGGAPMVIYVNSLTWSARKSRGFLFFSSAVLMPLAVTLVYLKFGDPVIQPAKAALMVLPPTLVGLVIGLKLGNRLDKGVFRRLTYGLLVFIACAAILGPMVFNHS